MFKEPVKLPSLYPEDFQKTERYTQNIHFGACDS